MRSITFDTVESERLINLNFDPVEHRYYDDDGNDLVSVTTFIDEFKNKYDKEYWSIYRALDQARYKLIPYKESREIGIKFGNSVFRLSLKQIKQNIANGKIDLHKDPKTILKEWQDEADEACKVGNEKHDYLEECINKFYGKDDGVKTVVDIPKAKVPNAPFDYVFAIKTAEDIENSPLKGSDPEVYRVLLGAINAGFTLYAEVKVYSSVFMVSGTIDVFAVRGNEFVIIDWKTNKDELKWYSGYYVKEWNATRTEKIKTDKWVNTNDTFKKPIDHLPDCKGYGYSLQLSMYAVLAERWGYKCKGLVLCHLLGVRNEDKSTKIYGDIKFLEKEVKDMLMTRYRSLNGLRRRVIR